MDTVATQTKIFSETESSAFVGRIEEMYQLLDHCRDENLSKGLSVLAPPASGSSELLTQVYDRLFFEQDRQIPFYFKVRPGDRTALDAARRFLHEFLVQTVAFRIKSPSLIGAAPELKEISDLALARDAEWIGGSIDSEGVYRTHDDGRTFIRHCLSTPLRAAAGGSPAFVIFDDLHEALLLEDGEEFLDDLMVIFARSTIPVVFCGRRRFLYDRTKFPVLRLEHLSFSEAGRLVEQEASQLKIPINDQTRDLIAVQLGSSPAHISAFIASAAGAEAELSSFAATEQFYTDEIFGGRLSRLLSSILDRIAPDSQVQTAIVDLMKETIDAEGNRLPISRWRERLDASKEDFEFLVNALYHHEFINLDGANVTFNIADTLVKDYVEARALLGSDDKTRALTVGEVTARNVKRAPQLMAHFYRKTSSLGLLGLMKAFDGRKISPALMDYGHYKTELKGVEHDGALKAVIEDNARMRLPNCIFSAHTSAYYPRFDEICESERSVTAICVNEAADEPETAWLAVEIDSKLEATRELADFWCDRLEMAAVHCGFDNYRFWLVASEGFDEEALSALEAHGAIGSSRSQAELLAELLLYKADVSDESSAEVYEFIVPMGDDTEMIAAHTVEEIARRHNFPTKTINQIKTALVEACINAAEHSLSPDRRLHQTFSVESEKITITVASRGLRMADKRSQGPVSNGGRRGWGLKLIKGLMDEVSIDSSDDGTCVTMVKYLPATSDPPM